ncbi:MAG: DUF6318 family protein [Actinopolymorphaceae bacterium]
MRSTAGWIAGLAGGLAMALGACGGTPDDPEGATKDARPRPSASASATASESPSPAAKGAEVAADDEAAAKKFVQRFLSAHDKAMTDGDFSAVTAMSADECGNCQMSATFYSKLYEDGGKVEGGTFTDPKYQVTGKDDGSVVVEVTSTVSAYEIVSADGSTKEFPAKDNDSTFTLTKSADGSWHIASWTYD